ncbi:hypothetical protein CO165_00485, partial [Candidatus Roizmanbacteria bacterium CG_4_9_14_3_um_filter_33_18]
VLLVSSSAVKINSDGANYVQIMKNGKPIDQIVEIGLASDSQTEIISGLGEGDIVITSTTQTTSTTTQQTKSVFGSFGGGQGGNVRIQGR